MVSKQTKNRLDVLLVNRGMFSTREKARVAIMAGQVIVNNLKIDKPGKLVDNDSAIRILERQKYVSRGGLKLEKAISAFKVNMDEKIVLDIGASTGGFTDCALQHGAKKVYAVDVGYGQLDWSLRHNPSVVVFERTNIRYLEASKLDEIPDFATIDVSFISLTLIFPLLDKLIRPDAKGIALIKPQFEAGREKVGKKGVVRDPAVHNEVINKIISFLTGLDWGVLGLDYSPVKGPEGNIEYLLYFSKHPSQKKNYDHLVNNVVKFAHLELSPQKGLLHLS